MRRPVLVCISALLAAVITVAAAQQSPISFASEIYIVTEVPGADGTVEEVLTPATTAIPGQVVEYRVHATNSGAVTIAAGRVQILGPIQAGMEFVEGSATPSSEHVLTEFTVDGETFSRGPLLTGAGVNRRVVDPREYRTIRWTLLEPMEAGQTEVFTYRVRIVPSQPVAGAGFGFEILSVSYRWEGNYLYVVGEVRNVSGVPMGVELQAIARDSAGRLVDVATFWPASVSNIPAGGTYGFRYAVTQQRSATSVEVKVVGSNNWR